MPILSSSGLARTIAAGLALVLLATGCLPTPSQPAAPTAPSAPPVSLKVANLPFIAMAPFYIGLDEGYFSDQNLNIELVNFATQPDTIGAFVSGQIDVIGGQTSAGLFNLIARGADARIVADKGYIDANACDNIALIASPSSIPAGEAVTGDVLRGKKLDFVQGSWNEYLADKLLASVGLSTADFDNVDIPSVSQIKAMEAGQIDLAVNNEPWLTRLLADGNTTVLKPPSQIVPGSESAITMVGQKLIGPNAEVGNRFMVAYLRAVRQYNEGKTDRNVAILSKYTQLDAGLLKQMCWPAMRSDGAVNVDSLLDFQEWAMGKGLQQTALTREQMWDPSFANIANQRLSGH
jgi:NitT/TauT family transport system substrate-binding protein